jgi:hypothetical protein
MFRMGQGARGLGIVGTMLVAGACYNTVPLQSDQPHPERELQIVLTAAGAERLSGVIGPTIVQVRGKPLEWRSDSVALAMTATVTARADEHYWSGQRVAIPRDAIAAISERRFSAGRTVGAAAVIVGLALIVREGVSGRGGGTPRPPTSTPGL